MLGGMSRLPPHEIAARARAAIAYAGLDYTEIARELNIDRTTLARRLLKKGKDRKSALTPDDLRYIVKRTGVGDAWFTADFSRLEEIALPPRPLADVAEEAAQLRADKNRPPLGSDEHHPGSDQAA